MQIKCLALGEYQANCYIIQIDKDVLIIDPGAEFKKIDKFVDGLTLEAILLTHNHFDHVGAVSDLKNKYNVDIYDGNNLEEKKYSLGKFKFDVLKTPGHTSDSITFYFENEKIMFTGDFLFKNNIGRTDLPTGDYTVILKSLEKIKKYDDKIVIFPGHGDSTTLGYEKLNNPYLKNL